MREIAQTLALALVCTAALGANVAKQPKPADVDNLPVNQWTPAEVSGFKGKAVTNGGGLAQGFLYLPPAMGAGKP